MTIFFSYDTPYQYYKIDKEKKNIYMDQNHKNTSTIILRCVPIFMALMASLQIVYYGQKGNALQKL